MSEINYIYCDYNSFIKRWSTEIAELRMQLMNTEKSVYQKHYIKGQIQAIENMIEVLKDAFM